MMFISTLGLEGEERVAALKSNSMFGVVHRNAKFFDYKVDRGGAIEAKTYAYHFARDYGVAYQSLSENRPKGLLLVGPIGVGKTFLAACAGNYLMEKFGLQAIMGNPSNLVSSLAEMMSDEHVATFASEKAAIQKLKYVPLLILDDIGREKYGNEWSSKHSALFQIIDSRYNDNMPIIATSNVPQKVLASYIGEATCDRLFAMCHPFALVGSSYR